MCVQMLQRFGEEAEMATTRQVPPGVDGLKLCAALQEAGQAYPATTLGQAQRRQHGGGTHQIQHGSQAMRRHFVHLLAVRGPTSNTDSAPLLRAMWTRSMFVIDAMTCIPASLSLVNALLA